jgi:hypothetical protein
MAADLDAAMQGEAAGMPGMGMGAGRTMMPNDNATQLGLDIDQFREDLTLHPLAARVAQDVDSADRSGVAGTPTFFINDRRHDGPQDLTTLNRVIRETRAQMLALDSADSGISSGRDADENENDRASLGPPQQRPGKARRDRRLIRQEILNG